MNAMQRTHDLTRDADLLHAALYHSSPARFALDGRQRLQAFVLCDGYGSRSADELIEAGLTADWSHVRDSSDEARVRAAAYVREQLGSVGLAKVAQLLGQAPLCAVCEAVEGTVDAQWDHREVKVCADCFENETGDKP
jgi:hypothetical protein